MRIQIAILTTAMLALTACTNSNDSATPPQALLPKIPANSTQATNPSQPVNSQTTSLPADVALPPAPPVRPPTTEPGSMDDPVATFGNNTITYRELEPILLSSQGLNTMLLVFQRDFARHEAEAQKIPVTEADIANERAIFMEGLKKHTREIADPAHPTTQPVDDLNLTPDQLEQLLDKELEQEHASRAEFDVYIETDAILRKIAEPIVQSHMTDAALHAQFNAEYGERISVECIALHDHTEAGKARQAIRNGESFESVARRMSIDRETAVTGGKLEPFTIKDNRYPDVFKDVAFSLEIGQISADDISIGQDVRGITNGVYILKLISRTPPAYAKFETYADSVKQDLHDELMNATRQAQRKKMQQIAIQLLKVQDPILKRRWEEMINPPTTHDPNEIRREMDAQHAPASATMPATVPAAQ
jgi:hypothetical protein